MAIRFFDMFAGISGFRSGLESASGFECTGHCEIDKYAKLYLFEAPIDMLSFISMHKDHWKTHSYATACCISSRVLHQMMKDNPNIKEVYLCLDNDNAGQIGNKRISEELRKLGIPHEILVPLHKDWNEDLLYPAEEQEEETECMQPML